MLGQRIKELRQEKSYSISELASRAGVSKSYLSYIERNVHKNPSLQVLNKIAATLETSVENLLEREQEAKDSIDKEWTLLLQKAISYGISKQELKEILNYLRFKKSVEEYHNRRF